MAEDSEGTAIEVLFELYYDIGARLCERLGHDWEDVQMGEGTARPINSIPYQKCARCSETRKDPKWNVSSGTQVTWERNP